MAVEIREVKTRAEETLFVQFANKLYKGNPCYCPTLDFDERNTFNSKKNPTLQFSPFCRFLAFRDGVCVGRICGLINHRANEAWQVKKLRFGWFDFVDDLEVSKALLDAVVAWGKQYGMTELNGPVGFTDLDKEGMLIEGFDIQCPMSLQYNAPYYQKHVEAYGMTKEADWVELVMQVPEDLDPKWYRVADIATRRSKLHVVHLTGPADLKRRYPNNEWFQALSDSYSKLYNFQPLTPEQMKYYCSIYIPLMNFDFLPVVENEQGEVVACAIGMPDVTKALQKSGGKLFPFGWYHLIKALKAKQIDHWNFLIIYVRPDYQDKGVNALIFADQMKYFRQYGIRTADCSNILETNKKNLANFSYFENRAAARRRAFTKLINGQSPN